MLTKRFKYSLVLLLCILVGISAIAQSTNKSKSKYKVETTFDESKGITIVFIKPMRVIWTPLNTIGILHTDKLEMAVFFTYPGKNLIKQDTVGIGFASSSAWGAQYDKRRDLTAIIDGVRLDLGQAELQETHRINLGQKPYAKGDNLVYTDETLTIDVPSESFRQIVKGKNVKMQLGPNKFSLAEDQLAVLRELSDRMQP